MYNLDESKKNRTNELMSSIRTYLIDNFGRLIYKEITAFYLILNLSSNFNFY